VLAYTVHNVLLQCISHQESPLTVLNFGASDVMDVVMEDVFGQTSEDRVSIENRTTYKEVKATKSMDTLEQVARIVGPGHVATLLAPLRDLMHQTEAVKAVKGMDDCLRRIAAGLNVNEHLSSSELLPLCHSLLTSNADFLRSNQRAASGKKGRKGGGLVLRKRSEVEDGAGKDHYVRNAYKFVDFGLDMLINGLRKGRFDYSDGDILGRLDPMIDAVGNCLYAQQGSTITASLKALALLVKCPIPSTQAALPLLIRQTLKIVDKEGTNAQSDVLMAALKLLTVLIRDVQSSHLQDNQLTQLCRLVDMNLEEEAEMQGVLFGLLRAIIGRKFVVGEVYDVMDKVATIMVTSQSGSIRELSRSTYLAFLLELPQGQQRFTNQMRFLAKNVNYTFESGRLSILEFLRIILLKMKEEVLREHLNLFFVSLVMCLGNDESSKCKEKAAKLIVDIVALSREEERSKLVELIHIWAQSSQDNEKKGLVRIAMMIYSLLLESPVLQKQDSWKAKALQNARRVLVTFVRSLEDAEMTIEEDEEGGHVEEDWQVPYQALQVISKLYRKGSKELENDEETWGAVHDLLLFPHTWVRLASCRLIGQRLSQMEIEAPRGGEGSFASVHNLLSLTRKMSLMLKSEYLDSVVALQVVKNLVFVGKCFALVTVVVQEEEEQEEGTGLGETGAGEEDDGSEDDEDDAHDWSIENPLRWMLTKLSHQLRQSKLAMASVESVSLLEPSSLLQWFAAMVNHLPAEQSSLFLLQIISPLYRLLEADVHLARGNEDFASLQTLASEVQDLVQKKLGTSVYASTYTTIKRRMAEKRKRRKDEALMLAIQDPEKAMRRKAATNKRKHDSRRRKTQSYAQSKDRVRPIKRQK
jgi:U3 small nucleolar RNA-associated protein 20